VILTLLNLEMSSHSSKKNSKEAKQPLKLVGLVEETKKINERENKSPSLSIGKSKKEEFETSNGKL